MVALPRMIISFICLQYLLPELCVFVWHALVYDYCPLQNLFRLLTFHTYWLCLQNSCINFIAHFLLKSWPTNSIYAIKKESAMIVKKIFNTWYECYTCVVFCLYLSQKLLLLNLIVFADQTLGRISISLVTIPTQTYFYEILICIFVNKVWSWIGIWEYVCCTSTALHAICLTSSLNTCMSAITPQSQSPS